MNINFYKMHAVWISILLLQCSQLLAQCIIFTYDAAGNRTQRNICPAPLPAQAEQEVISLQEQDLLMDKTWDESDVRVTPNPSAGLFTLTASGLPVETPLLILDIHGRVIRKGVLGDGVVDLQQHAAGMYILRLELPQKIISKKVVKN